MKLWLLAVLHTAYTGVAMIVASVIEIYVRFLWSPYGI